MKYSALSGAAVFASVFPQSASGQTLAEILSQENSTLSTLTSLINDLPALGETFSSQSNLTILAPSNDAFAMLLKDEKAAALVMSDPAFVANLLSYHILNGSLLANDFSETPAFAKTLLTDGALTNVTGGQVVAAKTANNAVSISSAFGAHCQVIRADIEYDGGVVHVVDGVLEIPKDLAETASAAGLSAVAEALTKADLVAPLTWAKDVTIFAPSNEAFEAVASATKNMSVESLKKVLQYHVLPNVVAYSSSFEDGAVKTFEGTEINVSVKDGNVYVNGAKVITPDVPLSNGVLHVIDSVLNPDKQDDAASSTASAPSATWTGADSTASPSGSATPGSRVSSSAWKGMRQMSAAIAMTVMSGVAAFFMV
ncbi:fasciclin domain-containing protein [Hirsutella rhossiliensis]|uniref:Fasciclin domain-containing protein n=1 Tax=Hirsutella rhossiliensis TaxID=111463 RepID=A0A9P8MPH9_9HYPO|nr:fasciclin domain-containing protein [Hirsutella rhossiliensis]KAH0959923.1 fasciclin domain-containing protein [Hirsutella rhossiliensis]